VDELRELLDITEQCMRRAVVAQRETAKYAEHYRSQAEELRRQATRTRSPEVRATLLRIAASHARLARLAEGVKGMSADASNGSAVRETPAEAAEASEFPEQPPRKKPAEDPISQARRHVAEAQNRIERQEELVARLASDSRHAPLAAEAREILQTLRHSLSLAREHLDLELKKRSLAR
jgi:hypothetical protein